VEPKSPSSSALVVQPEASKLPAVPGGPRLSAATGEQLREIQILDERNEHRVIQVPLERPLRLIVDGLELVTLLTLGASPEWLVAGYLRNQRLVEDVTQLESIAVDWLSGTAVVSTRNGSAAEKLASARQPRGTGCGLGTGFGDLLSGGAVRKLSSLPRISRTTLLSILETMRHYDAIHRAAGSVHSCALFQDATLWIAIEDVSRHNGIDTIAGWMALHGVEGAEKILFTTGRLTAEMVMKAAHNAIAIMISRNGVTALGFELARRFGQTLFGRASNGRYSCYTGLERFDSAS
jgi:FdhD protein